MVAARDFTLLLRDFFVMAIKLVGESVEILQESGRARRKERPAKLVREARQNRMGAQRGRGGDGVAA